MVDFTFLGYLIEIQILNTFFYSLLHVREVDFIDFNFNFAEIRLFEYIVFSWRLFYNHLGFCSGCMFSDNLRFSAF